ncbi:MAG: hypothetical protein NT138_14365 [Planctomycetales bacterium]|jgi:hypothetical protein|nr:hypothetical protein [Planctomycetales bacterium]
MFESLGTFLRRQIILCAATIEALVCMMDPANTWPQFMPRAEYSFHA